MPAVAERVNRRGCPATGAALRRYYWTGPAATHRFLHSSRTFDAREFFLVYQPVVSLADGRCAGGEALIRWQRSDTVVVDAGGFMPATYATPLSGLITYWVMDPGGMQEVQMNASSREMILRRFSTPDETREMTKGRFEIVRIGGLTIGRATYDPGWRWSQHVGRALGQTHCEVEHVGLVVSGAATAAFRDGRVIEMRAGDLFYVPPEPHDSWVVGSEPYVSLHFLGADHYAR